MVESEFVLGGLEPLFDLPTRALDHLNAWRALHTCNDISIGMCGPDTDGA